MTEQEKTRELWLQQAVHEIDAQIFNGELESSTHKFQINCGRVKNDKQSECVQPTDVEDLPLKDFFPTSISIDWRLEDPVDILASIAYECPRAFLGLRKPKEFHDALEKYYFEKPYKEVHPSDILREKLRKINEDLNKTIGPWPGKAVKFPDKKCNGKERVSNKITYFCPECGFEVYTYKKNIKKGNERKTPMCSCGCKMGIAEDTPNESGNSDVQGK